MKKIKTTHIDTGGHGYYSVSKKDIQLLGIADKISSYSGHDLTRVYLEEDCDAQLLYDAAKEKEYVIVSKSGYNLKFNLNHGYNPKLFNYVPAAGDKVIINKEVYKIVFVDKKTIIVEDPTAKQYRIPVSNPFKYIQGVI